MVVAIIQRPHALMAALDKRGQSRQLSVQITIFATAWFSIITQSAFGLLNSSPFVYVESWRNDLAGREQIG